jgi:hypothetical protein
VARYKKYLNHALQILDDKRKKCKHGHFHTVVYFKRCADCGAYIPFRIEADLTKRGEMGRLDYYYDNDHSVKNEDFSQ